MRRAAISAFVAGFVVYPVSFLLTVNAIRSEVDERSISSKSAVFAISCPKSASAANV